MALRTSAEGEIPSMGLLGLLGCEPEASWPGWRVPLSEAHVTPRADVDVEAQVSPSSGCLAAWPGRSVVTKDDGSVTPMGSGAVSARPCLLGVLRPGYLPCDEGLLPEAAMPARGCSRETLGSCGRLLLALPTNVDVPGIAGAEALARIAWGCPRSMAAMPHC